MDGQQQNSILSVIRPKRLTIPHNVDPFSGTEARLSSRDSSTMTLQSPEPTTVSAVDIAAEKIKVTFSKVLDIQAARVQFKDFIDGIRDSLNNLNFENLYVATREQLHVLEKFDQSQPEQNRLFYPYLSLITPYKVENVLNMTLKEAIFRSDRKKAVENWLNTLNKQHELSILPLSQLENALKLQDQLLTSPIIQYATASMYSSSDFQAEDDISEYCDNNITMTLAEAGRKCSEVEDRFSETKKNTLFCDTSLKVLSQEGCKSNKGLIDKVEDFLKNDNVNDIFPKATWLNYTDNSKNNRIVVTKFKDTCTRALKRNSLVITNKYKAAGRAKANDTLAHRRTQSVATKVGPAVPQATASLLLPWHKWAYHIIMCYESVSCLHYTFIKLKKILRELSDTLALQTDLKIGKSIVDRWIQLHEISNTITNSLQAYYNDHYKQEKIERPRSDCVVTFLCNNIDENVNEFITDLTQWSNETRLGPFSSKEYKEDIRRSDCEDILQTIAFDLICKAKQINITRKDGYKSPIVTSDGSSEEKITSERFELFKTLIAEGLREPTAKDKEDFLELAYLESIYASRIELMSVINGYIDDYKHNPCDAVYTSIKDKIIDIGNFFSNRAKPLDEAELLNRFRECHPVYEAFEKTPALDNAKAIVDKVKAKYKGTWQDKLSGDCQKIINSSSVEEMKQCLAAEQDYFVTRCLQINEFKTIKTLFLQTRIRKEVTEKFKQLDNLRHKKYVFDEEDTCNKEPILAEHVPAKNAVIARDSIILKRRDSLLITDDSLDLMLKLRVSPNSQLKGGNLDTLLHACLRQSLSRYVEFLLNHVNHEAVASLTTKNKDKQTPFDLDEKNMLLDFRFSKGKYIGQSLLHYAIKKKNNLLVIEFLNKLAFCDEHEWDAKFPLGDEEIEETKEIEKILDGTLADERKKYEIAEGNYNSIINTISAMMDRLKQQESQSTLATKQKLKPLRDFYEALSAEFENGKREAIVTLSQKQAADNTSHPDNINIKNKLANIKSIQHAQIHYTAIKHIVSASLVDVEHYLKGKIRSYSLTSAHSKILHAKIAVLGTLRTTVMTAINSGERNNIKKIMMAIDEFLSKDETLSIKRNKWHFWQTPRSKLILTKTLAKIRLLDEVTSTTDQQLIKNVICS